MIVETETKQVTLHKRETIVRLSTSWENAILRSALEAVLSSERFLHTASAKDFLSDLRQQLRDANSKILGQGGYGNDPPQR